MEIGNTRARRMGAIIGITSLIGLAGPSWAQPLQAFINEIHYDNQGPDRAEGVEIAAPAGTRLDGWQVVFYDGRRGTTYATIDLEGEVADAGDGYGFSYLAKRGIQNGAPDGLALVDDQGQLLQFLSYEGTFDAVDGVAAGMTSLDIGVMEEADTPAGWSLQLTGSGIRAADFHWVLAEASFGRSNQGQRFDYGGTARIPEPPALLLLLAGLPLLGHRLMPVRQVAG